MPQKITVCSVYLRPRDPLDTGLIDELVNQLPTPILLLGDFNAHNVAWGSPTTGTKGSHLLKTIEKHDLIPMNNKKPTHLCPRTGTLRNIDITLCSPSLYLTYSWEVHSDTCGSDHYPILIRSNEKKIDNFRLDQDTTLRKQIGQNFKIT